ncbi:L-aspartate oxidase [Kangiella sp. HZ709]|uniref:L-aspartate oxidase n=1 Tax=Kangiella sp. HZ709 TaxID=2666328 RepID=UPI0012AF4459|nr:L-aspartate oxidase [Kangiella sp. HZ709]MRX27354.1 L-aspartate oxidase [Kangiella sp. HZ709]
MHSNKSQIQTDVLVIGSGAAGLSAALRLSHLGKVTVLSKAEITEGSTFYAQGGIAAVLHKNDSVDSHVADTLIAGGGLCDEKAVRFTVEHSTDAIHWLIDRGVAFSKQDQEYHLTREGGHSQRRIIHSDDATGKAVSTTLVAAVKNETSIEILEHYIAVDLITEHKLGNDDRENRCIGAYVLNLAQDRVETISARFVILATGGASKVYLYTSNPDVASGDGIAMAWRAGCSVTNLEFNQFHPTCLYHPEARSFLITEALRGEGALLRRPNGERFMPDYDDRAELASRDIVAQAIDHEIKKLGIDCVYLDISHKDPEFIKSHFPTIYKKLLNYGIDITVDAIPVVPAAHYTCGGVTVDLNSQTDIAGLYAIGEVAYTGLHGANRMASNSLLECLVFAQSAANNIEQHWQANQGQRILPCWDESQVTNSDEEVILNHNWHELRQLMWNYVGIVRSDKRLERALRRIELLQQEIHDYYANFKVSNDLIELRNLVVVAELIVRCALERKESRGLHFTLDYPLVLDNAVETVLKPNSLI